MSKKMRVAVTGMGNMGRGHAANMIAFEDVELVALCDADPEAAERFQNEHGLACSLYTDFDRMIEEEHPDAVYICLPPFCHNGQFEAAAEKGIAVFIEKPIALHVERGEAMAEAAARSGVVTQVGYQMRFGAAVRRLMELIESGQAGRPMLFSASYECNSLHGPWWRDKEKCGGQVFEQVIHLYDLAQYIMGPAREVSGRVANLGHRDIPDYTVEDTSVANIVFESGALGCITGSNCAVKEQWNARFRVICGNLVASFEDFNHAEFIYTGEHAGNIEIIRAADPVTELEDRHFIDCVAGRKEPFATVEDGLAGLKLVAGVVRSSEQDGMVIRL